jgi:hypothetical protein
MPNQPFRLEPHERMSSTWIGISRHLTRRLEQLRTELEGPLGIEPSSDRRGRIAEIRSLLKLAEDLPIQPPAL